MGGGGNTGDERSQLKYIIEMNDVTSTSLDDPLYYLRNALQIVHLCLNNYSDLLLQDEVDTLQQLLLLDTSAQALLIRMVMRKGLLFRTDKLHYNEVSNLDEAIHNLTKTGYVNHQPDISISCLCEVSRREECLEIAQRIAPELAFSGSTRKTDIVTALVSTFQNDHPKPLKEWWSDSPFNIIELRCNDLFDRLRLMFFGNLYQSWSEFVITELGLQRFEKVSLTSESRPFQSRSEVDLYLNLYQLQQRATEGERLDSLAKLIPSSIDCSWIDYRRSKVIYLLGREAERQKNTDLALSLYQQSQHHEAQLRALRFLEKSSPAEQVFVLAKESHFNITKPEVRIGIERILKRSARKLGIEFNTSKTIEIPIETIELKKPDQGRVERTVIAYLSNTDTQLFHVENKLFTGLFALLFWPALFAPIRGAFFNPFQSGPADLYRPTFSEERTELLSQSFDQLQSGGHVRAILDRLEQKQGISCSLIHWPSLDRTLVEETLDVIPAKHLEAVFRHLLLDLRNHRKGMPDLIELNKATRQYRLIEVKGPGDRLQDHQKLWLEVMLENEIPASVLNVNWRESDICR